MVGFCAMVWIIIFFCAAFDVTWTGRFSYVTMGSMPIVVIFIFLGKAVSLDGAQAGISQYIGMWDTSVLKEKGCLERCCGTHFLFHFSRVCHFDGRMGRIESVTNQRC
jgi:solute carrier family 6 GABA transporter-like protein 1